MIRKIIADVNEYETRVAVIEDGELVEIQVEMRGQERLVGNIYKGRVQNILPGMQAAFIDIGLDRNAFLYADDIYADKSDFEFKSQSADEVEGQFKSKNVKSIKDMLVKDQEIMVQILKQPGGAKGARVTTHITLPGRKLVLMPTVDHIGVSRRITDEEERDRLKELFTRIKPEGMGIIVRTVAKGASEEELTEEIRFLARLWERIKHKSKMLTAPRLLHSEETLLFRSVRDIFNEDAESFILADKDAYERVLAVVDITMPHLKDRVRMEKCEGGIFTKYGIENKIDKALQRKVWLKNGAYLVIDEAEALTAIDVNSGKYIGDDDLQQTILDVNLEAAQEIAKQLRLRDLGGIIVIDFIDMEDTVNKNKVVAALEEALERDRTKTNVLGMTELGLVELTRKKVRRPLSQLMLATCEHCDGKGKRYSAQALALRIRREALELTARIDNAEFLIEAVPRAVEYIAEMNARGETLFPANCGKTFYMTEICEDLESEIRISPVTDIKCIRKAQRIE